MQSDKRVVTHQDDDVLYRRPMHLLANQELFGLMALGGGRLLPALEEILKRIKESPVFMLEMFEFGDANQNGKKFSEWFSSPLFGLGAINAKIISEIANHDLFSSRSADFLPTNLNAELRGRGLAKRQDVILAYLTHIEKPEIVFSSLSSGLLQPVIFALQYLQESQPKNDVIQSLFEYLKIHAKKLAGEPNRFGPNTDLREPFEKLVSSFTDDQSITSVSDVLGIVSCFSGADISAPCTDLPSISAALNNKQFSTTFASKVICEITKENSFTPETLASYIDGTRSLDILSTIVPRKSLLKLAPREVRGQALSDELGL